MIKTVNKIALIGATSRIEKYGNIIFRDLINKGYKVFPVNPALKEIEGYKVFNDIGLLPEDPDLYVFVIPWRSGLKTVKELIDKGKNNFWFQPGAESPEIMEYFKNKEGVKYSFNRCIMVKSMKRGDLEF